MNNTQNNTYSTVSDGKGFSVDSGIIINLLYDNILWNNNKKF